MSMTTSFQFKLRDLSCELQRIAKGSGKALKDVELLWDRFQKMRGMLQGMKGMFPGMGGLMGRGKPPSPPRTVDREKLKKARKMAKQRRKQGRH